MVVAEAEMAGELGRYLHQGFQCRIMKNGVVLGRFPDGAWVPYATPTGPQGPVPKPHDAPILDRTYLYML